MTFTFPGFWMQLGMVSFFLATAGLLLEYILNVNLYHKSFPPKPSKYFMHYWFKKM